MKENDMMSDAHILDDISEEHMNASINTPLREDAFTKLYQLINF